jgi:hypothetical protein
LGFRVKYESFGDLRELSVKSLVTNITKKGLSRSPIVVCPTADMESVGSWEIQLGTHKIFSDIDFIVGTTSYTKGWLVIETFVTGENHTNLLDSGSFAVGVGVKSNVVSTTDGVKMNGTCVGSESFIWYYTFNKTGCTNMAVRLMPGPTTKISMFGKWGNARNLTEADLMYGINTYQSLSISDNTLSVGVCTEDYVILSILGRCSPDGPGKHFSNFSYL